VLPLLPSPAGLLWGISPLPPFSAQGAPPSLLHVFFIVVVYYSVFFSFFPGWGRSVQGAVLIWPRVVCGSTTCCLAHLVVCIFPTCLGAGIWQGTGALLVSPCNVKWGCYAWGGGVEESKFCLFSVFFPVKCISSIFPRFYFRKHAFCFLPLATILESHHTLFKRSSRRKGFRETVPLRPNLGRWPVGGIIEPSL
jgi:hypothetical protein